MTIVLAVGTALLALLALVAVAIVAFFAWGHSEHTACFGAFDSRQAADRAASAMREAGHDAEVEPSGPRERDPQSIGGRLIAVTFKDGETDEDARGFRQAFHKAVEREDGVGGHPGSGCLEKTPFD